MHIYFYRFKNSADLLIHFYKNSSANPMTDAPDLVADATLDIDRFDAMNRIGQFEYLGENDDVKFFKPSAAMMDFGATMGQGF